MESKLPVILAFASAGVLTVVLGIFTFINYANKPATASASEEESDITSEEDLYAWDSESSELQTFGTDASDLVSDSPSSSSEEPTGVDEETEEYEGPEPDLYRINYDPADSYNNSDFSDSLLNDVSINIDDDSAVNIALSLLKHYCTTKNYNCKQLGFLSTNDSVYSFEYLGDVVQVYVYKDSMNETTGYLTEV